MEQELLYKYFKGTTSEEEERLILDWVDASPENRKAFQKERMLPRWRYGDRVHVAYVY